ncbi:hypothetical protein FO519_000582 [Halicephalobus sp. NKZ332]|nr:hypothetical protein FO519_000582 [Halicephalobus sp. NKZ332]
MKLYIAVLLVTVIAVEATHKCVWVRGILRCNKDPSKNFNIEVRVYDRDGISLFQMFDPDDLMGVSFTEQDGNFQLDGCGDDFNWFPGVENPPEPYIQIHHFCNSDRGETIKLPMFETFVPDTHDIGILELDKEEPKPIDVNKKSGEVQIVHTADGDELSIGPHGNEFVDQVHNPKFNAGVVKTLDQDEDSSETKKRVMITHPDGALN